MESKRLGVGCRLLFFKFFILVSVGSSANGANVSLYDYRGASNQRWVFEKVNFTGFNGSATALKNSMSSIIESRPIPGDGVWYYNTPSQCLDIIMAYDDHITNVSNNYHMPKSYIQTLLMRELYYDNPTDRAADSLVVQYFAWEQAVEDWNKDPLKYLKPYPTPPTPLKTDSSTGLGQIFAQTCIDAQNYVKGTSINWNNWRQRKSVWDSLRNNDYYNIEAVAYR